MTGPQTPVAALLAVARVLHERAGAPRARAGTPLPALWLLTDSLRMPDPLPAVAALPAGCGVILRHYDAPGRTRLAQALAGICRERGLLLLVGADLELGRAVGAGGVHLPEALAATVAVRPEGVVTASAHGGEGLERAAQLGADAALLSPVFATDSRPSAAALGPARFAQLVAQLVAQLANAAALPVYALGGITPANAGELDGTGAAGIAAVGAFRSEPPT